LIKKELGEWMIFSGCYEFFSVLSYCCQEGHPTCKTWSKFQLGTSAHWRVQLGRSSTVISTKEDQLTNTDSDYHYHEGKKVHLHAINIA